MRSVFGMNAESAFSIVVLPVPVPPLMMMLSLRAHAHREELGRGLAHARRRAIRSAMRILSARNFRMVMRRRLRGHRRDGDVDARAIRQAGVDHRAGFVDAAAERRDDAFDDAHHVLACRGSATRAAEDAALLLVEDAVEVVDHDFRDGRVAQQRLQRAEAEDFVGDCFEQLFAADAAELDAFLRDELARGAASRLRAAVRAAGPRGAVLEFFDEQFVEANLRGFGLGVAAGRGIAGAAGASCGGARCAGGAPSPSGAARGVRLRPNRRRGVRRAGVRSRLPRGRRRRGRRPLRRRRPSPAAPRAELARRPQAARSVRPPAGAAPSGRAGVPVRAHAAPALRTSRRAARLSVRVPLVAIGSSATC